MSFICLGKPPDGLLKKMWKILEECGRKWKIMFNFVPDSVKDKGKKQ